MKRLLKLLTAIPYYGMSLLDRITLDSSLLFDITAMMWAVAPFFVIVLSALGVGALAGCPEGGMIAGAAVATVWFIHAVTRAW